MQQQRDGEELRDEESRAVLLVEADLGRTEGSPHRDEQLPECLEGEQVQQLQLFQPIIQQPLNAVDEPGLEPDDEPCELLASFERSWQRAAQLELLVDADPLELEQPEQCSVVLAELCPSHQPAPSSPRRLSDSARQQSEGGRCFPIGGRPLSMFFGSRSVPRSPVLLPGNRLVG